MTLYDLHLSDHIYVGGISYIGQAGCGGLFCLEYSPVVL